MCEIGTVRQVVRLHVGWMMMIFGDEHKLWSCFNGISYVTSYLALHSNLHSNSLCSSLNVADQVSHQYKSTVWLNTNNYNFYVLSQNCERRLLASSSLSVCHSVCSRGTTRLSMDWFSWNLIFEYLFKICRENWEVSLNSDKNNGCCTWRSVYFFDHTSLSSY